MANSDELLYVSKGHRPLSVILADAFDRAAHDVFVGPQVHEACTESPPSTYEIWVYWCRGFTAGLVNDYESKPLSVRLSNCLSKVRKNLLSPANRYTNRWK